MAGIGITLRRLTKNDSLFGAFRAQLYSMVLSSGAWVISISSLVIIYLFSVKEYGATSNAIPFLVSATYCTSFSLIVSGPFQQVLIRFIADKMFEKKQTHILGAVMSLCFFILVYAAIIGMIACYYMLDGVSIVITLLLFSSFMALNIIWLFSNAFAGLKDYRAVVAYFFLGYGVLFFLAIWGEWQHLWGFLVSYYIGQGILLFGFFRHFVKSFPSRVLANSKFWHYVPTRWILVINGFIFQLAIWIDKYIFWMSSRVNVPILGHLSASPIYDMPMFLSFLFVLPGLSVFFYEVEANFSHEYHRLYDAVRDGGTYLEITEKHNLQVITAQRGFMNVMLVEGFFCLLGILFAEEILLSVGLSSVYKYIFRIDLVSAFLMVLFIGVINLLYYLDKNRNVFWVVLVFLIINGFGTYYTVGLHPVWFGYGLTAGLFCAVLLGFHLLSRAFKQQIMAAFMSH